MSLSGSTGLVGALFENAKGGASGSAYLFLNLDTASGNVTENVKLFASDGASADLFGVSVSLDGDDFIIGAQSDDRSRGKAYTGSVSSMTKLDAGQRFPHDLRPQLHFKERLDHRPDHRQQQRYPFPPGTPPT